MSVFDPVSLHFWRCELPGSEWAVQARAEFPGNDPRCAEFGIFLL
jgi:hypothetical protein